MLGEEFVDEIFHEDGWWQFHLPFVLTRFSDRFCSHKVFDFFTPGELSESFTVLAVLLEDSQKTLDERGNIVEGDAFIDFTGDGLGVVDSASEDDVVTFDFFATLKFHGGPHEADVADVVLGAGMVTTGEVNIDGLIEFDFGLEVLAKDDGLAFGIGSGEFATGVAGAGDEPAGDGGSARCGLLRLARFIPAAGERNPITDDCHSSLILAESIISRTCDPKSNGLFFRLEIRLMSPREWRNHCSERTLHDLL